MTSDVIGKSLSPAIGPAPDGTPVTLSVKRCCGVLLGDVCDCAAFAAEARGVFARPIMCRPARLWGVQ